jgi:ATPases of the AAA+ class
MFRNLGLPPLGVRAVPASILLYGPPGCGKTKLAQAVAGEAQAAFLSIGPSDVLSKFVGESEASVKNLFEKAKSMAMRMESRCAVLFFDEIDALGMNRCGTGGSRWGGSDDSSSGNSSRRILAELLIQLTKLSDETGKLEKKKQDDGTGLDNREMSQGNEQRVEDCVDGQENDLKYQRSEKDADSTSLCSNHYEGSPRPISPESMEDANHRQPVQDCNKPRSIGHQSSHSQPHTHDDTVESHCPHRARIIVVAATNRPEDCDPALLRRFSIRVLVGLPSQRDRKKIIRRLLEGVENTLAPSQLKELATATEGWSGSDLESVTREAAMAPIRECLRAAAMLKMKVRNKRKFEQSQEQSEFSANMDVNDMARDKLLRGFMKLRPVNMKDFEEAITFWVGDDQEEMMPSMSKKSAVTHYDSESTSSSDVEPDIDEQLDD